jgi:hypothetical protein
MPVLASDRGIAELCIKRLTTKFCSFVIVMKKALVLFGLMISASWVHAQFVPGMGEDKIEVTPNIAPVKTILKVSLLSPFEPEHSIRLAAEITLGKNLSVEPEVGYIYDYVLGIYRLQKNLANFEQRLAFRYYIPEKFIGGLYCGPLFTYENFNYQEGVWKNFVPSNPDSMTLDFSNPWQFSESRFGLYIIAGIQPLLSRHFTLDLNGGFGIQRREVVTKFDPRLTGGAALPAREISYTPLGILSLHAGYVF